MRHNRSGFADAERRRSFGRWLRGALIGAIGIVMLAGCADDESAASTVPVESTASATATASVVATASPWRSNPVSPTPQSGSIWATRVPLLDPNSETAVAQLDGRIYVIGGYPSTRVYVNTVQVYDVQTDQWSYITPVPQPLHHTMAAGVNGRLYVIGGEISTTGVANQGIFIANVYEYDPATATWMEKAPMPTARSGGAAAVIDGTIHVVGGRPPRGSDHAVYDPATDTWTALPDLPTQRDHLAAGAIDGQLFVVGGRFVIGDHRGVGDAPIATHQRRNIVRRAVTIPVVEVRADRDEAVLREAARELPIEFVPPWCVRDQHDARIGSVAVGPGDVGVDRITTAAGDRLNAGDHAPSVPVSNEFHIRRSCRANDFAARESTGGSLVVW